MNCAELAATLENAASRAQTRTGVKRLANMRSDVLRCARLLELHQIEEQLTGLFAIEPSSALLENVMSRITQPGPVAFFRPGNLSRCSNSR